jgi:hypothetical protein
LHSDLFPWHAYHRHQGDGIHTESWDATGEVKSFLLFTNCQGHSTEIDAHRVRPALYGHCSVKETFAVRIQRRPRSVDTNVRGVTLTMCT